MDSFDVAEICEIAGLYSVKPKNILPRTNFGFYRNGLILLGNLNDRQMEKKRKTIIKTLKDFHNMV